MNLEKFKMQNHPNFGCRRFDRSVQTALGFALVFALAGCAPKSSPPAPPPPTVIVSKPLDKEVTDWDEYVGHLQSPQTVSIQARVSGLITEAPFKEGSLVGQGDVLFVIDEKPFKADLDNKRATVDKDAAQVDIARIQLARSAGLLKTKTIAQQDYDNAQATYAQAEAQWLADKAAEETSRLNLEWTHVLSPIAGRVSNMQVTVGNLVSAGAGPSAQATTLTSVVSVDPMYCYVPAPESAFLNYQAAAARDQHTGVRQAKIPCELELENETNFPRRGWIDFIDNNIDTKTGTIQMRGVIPNSSGDLTPGMTARMRITGTGAYRALLIPDSAVGTEQNERYLLLVGSDGKVVQRPVTLGALFGSLRVISSGLTAGENVVVNGLMKARPGTTVTAQEEPIPAKYVEALESNEKPLAEARP